MSNATETAIEQRTYGAILESQVNQGLVELRRDTVGLLSSGLAAGLEIGFSLFLMATMLTAVGDEIPAGVVRVLLANMYTVGFIFVILGRSELFTEHTSLAVFPVLQGRAGVGSLARLWTLIFLSNIAGAVIFAALAVLIGPPLGAIEPAAFGKIGRQLVEHTWWVILLSALLAGWLMGLLSWLVSATRDTIGLLFVVWLVTASIGFGHMHHAIAGSVEVLAAVFAGEGVTLGDYGHFILWTTIGNGLGGVIFVSLIKYCHARTRPCGPGGI